MGFLDFFLGKEKKTQSEDPKKRMEELSSVPKRIIKDFDDAKAEALKALGSLERAQFREEIDPRLRNMIQGSRTAFISKMRLRIGGAEPEERLETFKPGLEAFLKASNEEMRRYSQRVAIGFDAEMRAFSSGMAEFNEIAKKVDDVIERNREELESLSEHVRKKAEAEEAAGREAETAKELELVKKSISVKAKQLDSSTAELAALGSGKRASEHAALEKDLARLREEKEKILSRMRSFRSDMEKGLKDYARAAEKPAAKAIETFLEHPEDAGDADVLAKAVGEAARLVQSGAIALAPKRREKFLRTARTDLRQLFRELEAVKAGIASKEEATKVLGFPAMRAELENRMNDLKSDMGRLERSREELLKLQRETRRMLSELKKE